MAVSSSGMSLIPTGGGRARSVPLWQAGLILFGLVAITGLVLAIFDIRVLK